MTKQELEKSIFDAFLETQPKFMESLSKYEQPKDDPPDILCLMNDGQHIGFELKEWLNEEQMREAKGRERIEDSIRAAITNPHHERPTVGVFPPNNCKHIACLQLFPKVKLRLKDTDKDAFRTELYEIIEETDAIWLHDPMWRSPQGHRIDNFAHRTTLTKYLHGIRFYPQEFRAKDEIHWIHFPNRGGAYSEEPMVNALLETVADSIDKYRGAKLGYEFNLLIHYSQAILYNNSVETETYKIEDAVRAASDIVGDDAGVFDKIFLLIWGNAHRTFQLY